jgi:ATP-dependent RNA helicase HelY
LEVLVATGYLEEKEATLTLTPHGSALRRIYGERDLLVAECLRRQAWNDLTTPELVAMVATLVYEPRRDDHAVHPTDLPQGAYPQAFDHTRKLHRALSEVEAKHQLPETPPLAPHIALAFYRWSEGARLDDVLDSVELSAGDFVRWCKQVMDVLDQISTSGEGPVQRQATIARASIFRGIVALSSVV